MKKIVFFGLVLILSLPLKSQTAQEGYSEPRKNNVNLNILGEASFISVVFERTFSINSQQFIAGRFGLGYNAEFQFCLNGPCSTSPKRFMTIPHQLTANLGKKRNFIEFGIGGTYIVGNTTENYFLYPILAWRIHPHKSGKTNFRLIAAVPFSGLQTADIIWIPIGASFGWFL